MSLPRPLLVLLVAVCTTSLCAAEWPCPNAVDINPCICTFTNADHNIYMDCSNIGDGTELARVFATPFAFNDLKKLTIRPSVPSANLTILPHFVFGDKTFEEIEIVNTLIETVEEETFVNSHDNLTLLNLHRNEISSFPVETLELYTALQEFDISYNKLSGLSPDIVSDSLSFLDMSGNTGLTLTETTFLDAQNLTELRLSDMDLGNTTPANVFIDLLQLETLYLNNNGISGELIEDFINNNLRPLKTVELIGNNISSIHPLSVTGINPLGTISFKDNQIQNLPQEEWETLASLVTLDNAIDVTSNPLACLCDVMWLVFDPILMARFDENTMCDTGDLLAELPEEWFLEHCT